MSFSIKSLYCLYLPVLFFIYAALADQFSWPGFTYHELGLVENLQNLVLLYAFIIGAFITFAKTTNPVWLRLFVGTGTTAVLYILMEEISYGQHYFNWNTPEYWKTYNDQNETNLHNTSSWLDQKPRLILELGVIIGGLIVPFLRQYKPSLLPSRFSIILPENMTPIAILAILPRLHERLMDVLHNPDIELFTRISEIQEIYFYYFILVYLVLLWNKTRLKSA